MKKIPLPVSAIDVINTMSSISMEAVYIIDFQKRCFSYVADHDFFLCGYSQEDAMKLGYGFFQKVLHPDDVQLLTDMNDAIAERLLNPGEPLTNIQFFSCTFRIKFYYSKTGTDYVMAYQKVKPWIINGQANRYGLCLLSISAVETAGHLKTRYKNSLSFDEYSFDSRKWKRQRVKPLSNKQRSVLILAKHGKSGKEIADILHLSPKTVYNTEAQLFQALQVHSMTQAIVVATNRRLIFSTSALPVVEKDKKPKPKHVLTPEILARVQAGLDLQQSVRSLARNEGFSEAAIRKAIIQGKLTKKQ